MASAQPSFSSGALCPPSPPTPSPPPPLQKLRSSRAPVSGLVGNCGWVYTDFYQRCQRCCILLHCGTFHHNIGHCWRGGGHPFSHPIPHPRPTLDPPLWALQYCRLPREYNTFQLVLGVGLEQEAHGPWRSALTEDTVHKNVLKSFKQNMLSQVLDANFSLQYSNRHLDLPW